MKSGANSVASYSYDYVGNRDVTTLGNGTSTEYVYDSDPRYRLDTITHKKGANTLATIDYTDTARDNAGNPKSMTDWTGTWDYGYDDNNCLINATPPNPVPDQPAGGDYGYDWVGNRLNPPTGSNHMVYNKADQLTSWPGMHTYTYYGDGSLHQMKDASGTNILRSYTYTPDGLLDTSTYNSRTLTNTWDGDKNRVSFTADSTTHTFVYDTTAGIPAVIDENGIYYVREPNGGLIARLSGSDTNYYHFDALGSTRLLTDTDGDVTDKYAYDAYGSLISHDEFAGSVNQPYQYVGQLGYYTHYQEPEFGLLQLGVRFYDAEVGRFGQPDPYAVNEESCYSYVGGMPLMAIDPTGNWQWAWPPWGNPKPKPKPNPKPNPGDEALTALLKWYMSTTLKRDCKKTCPGLSPSLKVIDTLNNLGGKYKKASDTCMQSAREVCSSKSVEERQLACTDCCRAVMDAAGQGNTYADLGCFRGCNEVK